MKGPLPFFTGMTFQHIEWESLSLEEHSKLRKLSYLQETGQKSTDEESSECSSSITNCENLEDENWYFSTKRLKSEHRLTPAQRRLLLRKSGLMNIDQDESTNCKEIRNSRLKNSGCACSVTCEPETCACSIDGIECFVEDDEGSYPCSCSIYNCRNPFGYIQYSPDLVHDHFLKTIERVKIQDN